MQAFSDKVKNGHFTENFRRLRELEDALALVE